MKTRSNTPATTKSNAAVAAIVAAVSNPQNLGAFRIGAARVVDRHPEVADKVLKTVGVDTSRGIIGSRSANLGQACQVISNVASALKEHPDAAMTFWATAEDIMRHPKHNFPSNVPDADVIAQFRKERFGNKVTELVQADWV